MQAKSQERYVVIGGGAGGLELVVRLARKLRRESSVEVVLIDRNPTHIWKPLLHEVATGSLNSYHDESSYRSLARKHGFTFVLGSVTHIDSDSQSVTIAPVADDEGVQLVPERLYDYTDLVISVGSQSNDFGTPGVVDHCLMLDTREQAERFHSNFINQMHRVNAESAAEATLSVVIVGGGATGVELAADLHNVASRLPEYGFGEFSIDRLSVKVIEASPRLLSVLPERIGISVQKELEAIGITVCVDTLVSGVEAHAVLTKSGERHAADICVWAAGIRAPGFLKNSGLPVDRIGRVHVNADLTVVDSKNLFAIGDCCACRLDADSEQMVPPRAQSAHQMATAAAVNLLLKRRGRELKDFHYRDFGSLVSLSEFSTVGNLMGNLMRGTVFVEGWLARLFYLSLYRMHQMAVHGWGSTLLIMLGDRIYKATRAELKLH